MIVVIKIPVKLIPEWCWWFFGAALEKKPRLHTGAINSKPGLSSLFLFHSSFAKLGIIKIVWCDWEDVWTSLALPFLSDDCFMLGTWSSLLWYKQAIHPHTYVKVPVECSHVKRAKSHYLRSKLHPKCCNPLYSTLHATQ